MFVCSDSLNGCPDAQTAELIRYWDQALSTGYVIVKDLEEATTFKRAKIDQWRRQLENRPMHFAWLHASFIEGLFDAK
jgi:hypothetical protein